MPEAPVREVTVLAAGGTIAMSPKGDGGAVPSLDADALVQAVPQLAGLAGLRARTINNRPSVQLTASDALDIARAAAGAADSGHGVVVTHGTDTLEEVALLCDLLYGGEPPIVFTGAMRHASALGADGPANLFDAVVVAGAEGAEGLGVLVSFAGAVHAARAVRKADSTAPDAFASPRLGPIGRVQEGRAWMARRVPRFPPVPVASLDAIVHIVPAGLGADGTLVDAAVEAGADGIVGVVLGAGHTPPPFLAALRRAATRVPVVVTVRPERGSILRGTYAFEGAERDLRDGPLICAAALTPAAARIKLMACLGAGYTRRAIAGAFVPDDFQTGRGVHCHQAATEVSKERELGLRECATAAEEAYAQAKRMDFTTITDHDTIAGVLEIAGRPDVSISEELTARSPAATLAAAEVQFLSTLFLRARGRRT